MTPFDIGLLIIGAVLSLLSVLAIYAQNQRKAENQNKD